MSPMFKVRLMFGLRWKKSFPWDEILDQVANILLAILLTVAIFAAYGLADAIDQIGEEKIKTSQSQQMLGDCLHGSATFVVNGEAARCKVEWIKVAP